MVNHYDLRNPYNSANSAALVWLGIITETDITDRTLYGLYCEALHAVKLAIEEGAQAEDLAREIDALGASKHRIVSD